MQSLYIRELKCLNLYISDFFIILAFLEDKKMNIFHKQIHKERYKWVPTIGKNYKANFPKNREALYKISNDFNGKNPIYLIKEFTKIYSKIFHVN